MSEGKDGTLAAAAAAGGDGGGESGASGTLSSRGIVAIVGCGLGLGGAIAVKFASEGYSIAAMARSQASLDHVKASLGPVSKAGQQHAYYTMDATKKDDVDASFAKVVADFGGEVPIDVMVYNISESPASMQQTVMEIKPEALTESFNINALGALLCTQAVLPGMLAAKGRAMGATDKGTTKKGTILYTSTSSAFRSTAKTLRLAAGKMAVRALSQSVAKEYGKQGIHAVHIRMDCTYESPRNEALFAQMGMAEMYKTATGANKLATVADLAETYYALHEQPPMAWSNEIDLRPYTEDWTF